MSNLHARTADGKNFPTKKSLKEAIAAGAAVTFTDTSLFSDRGTFTADQVVPAYDVIVGPDPERNRKWYASITKDPKTGALKVS